MNKNAVKIIISILVIVMVICGIIISIIKQDNKKSNEIENKQYLNKEELREFSSYFSKDENYGFLLSNYNEANEIDLNKVIYTGAGMENKLTKEDEKEYLKVIKKDTVNVNVTAILKSDIEELFYRKTGENLLNIEEKLKNWVFLPNANKYCLAHGDGNYSKMQCNLGTKEGNIYTLYVETTNGLINNCKITLEKQEDKYIVKSNKINY